MQKSAVSSEIIASFCKSCVCFYPQVCNLTWWTLSEEPRREIPLQKMSSSGPPGSQGRRPNGHQTHHEITQHVRNSHTALIPAPLTHFLSLFPLCVCDGAGSEPARQVACGQAIGWCVSAVRRSEAAPAPRVPSLRESSFWSRFCCVNALLLVGINIFLYAYFA